MFGWSVVTDVGEIYCSFRFHQTTWNLPPRCVSSVCVLMSFHPDSRGGQQYENTTLFGMFFFPLQEGWLWTAFHDRINPWTFWLPHHWGSGRCLTRWSRTCNIPIRPMDWFFHPAQKGCVFLFDWDLKFTSDLFLYWFDVEFQEMGSKTMEVNTCSMLFRARDVVNIVPMYQALAKAFDVKKAPTIRETIVRCILGFSRGH